MSAYAPDAGDLVWLNFTPQSGREQAGKRPALVLSPHSYNSVTGLMVACPITSKAKGYPFEVSLPPECSLQGVVLSDHVRSLDWRARGASFVERVPALVLDQVRGKLSALVGGDGE